MSSRSADIVICGAGIMGISVAYQLAFKRGLKNLVIVDERAPLTLTSDKSTECYRNWWPGPGDAMVRLMNRSITLMEEMAHLSNNIFKLNRRGYLYLTTDSGRVAALRSSAKEAAALGAGELREHNTDTYKPNVSFDLPSPINGREPALSRPSQSEVAEKGAGGEGGESSDGADLLTSAGLIQKHFPYLDSDIVAALHVRRAGWLSAQTYGMWMLEQARSASVELVPARLTSVETAGGKVAAVTLSDGTQIKTSTFINAAGPHLARVGKLLNVEIPVTNELHLKSSFNDHLGIVARDAPLLICADEQRLAWTDEERSALSEDPATSGLLDLLPSGAHTRPEGDSAAQSILVLWDIHNKPVEPIFPIPEDPLYTEVALRGLGRILPGMRSYRERMPRPTVDGGYYTKTQENRPLAGPLPVPGAYVIGAASGYGIMAAAGMAELLANHIVGGKLTEYAPMFELARYEDPVYKTMLKNWGENWQL